MNNKSEILIFQTENGNTELQVKLEDETVWLNYLIGINRLFQGISGTSTRRESWRKKELVAKKCNSSKRGWERGDK